MIIPKPNEIFKADFNHIFNREYALYLPFMKPSFVSDQPVIASVLDALDSFVAIYDPVKHQYTYINAAGLAMFELKNLNEAENQKDHFRKTPYTAEQYTHLCEIVWAQNHWKEEALYVTQTGKEFWGHTQITLLLDADKTWFLFQIRDIEYRKKTEQQVLYNEERLRAVFEYAAIGIVVADKQGTILTANKFMESIFQYTVTELTGKKVEILLPGNLRSHHVHDREAYVKHPKVRPMGVGMQLEGCRKDGSLFPVEVSLGYFYEDKDLFAVAFIQDTTLQVRTTQELKKQKAVMEELNTNLETQVVNRTQALLETLQHLEEANNELEKALMKEKELSELKSRFVSMASHEFRTPLSTILSSATLVGKYVRSEEQPKREKHVHRIQASVGYLTDILEEFLSAGKLEEGRIKAHFTSFVWQEFMNGILADLVHILKEGQTIVFQHQGDSSLYLDSSLLRKILINLISNASKFSGEHTQIFLTSSLTANHFTIQVKDQGIGISKEDMHHLFERFFRGSNVTNIQGTGLGLHIVSNYVALMNGEVQIQSTLGEGTAIQIIFQLIHPPVEV